MIPVGGALETLVSLTSCIQGCIHQPAQRCRIEHNPMLGQDCVDKAAPAGSGEEAILRACSPGSGKTVPRQLLRPLFRSARLVLVKGHTPSVDFTRQGDDLLLRQSYNRLGRGGLLKGKPVILNLLGYVPVSGLCKDHVYHRCVPLGRHETYVEPGFKVNARF